MTLPAPPSEALVLSPPVPRHSQFKAAIFRRYVLSNGRVPAWGPADGDQLDRLLRESPSLDVTAFDGWLKNYFLSQDNPPGERPCRFIPRIYNYSQSVIDKFGRSVHAVGVTMQMQNQMRTRAAMLESRRRREEARRELQGSRQRLR